MTFVDLPVQNLAAATRFYESIGCCDGRQICLDRRV
jgi:predicted lactoylglutathione lyase